MSKKKKSAGARPQGEKQQTPSGDEQNLTPSQRAAREDLGDFAGITMGDEPRRQKEEPALPDDEIVLAVEEDRTRLALQGVGYLVLAFAGLFFVAGGIGATQIAQNVAYLALILIGLPVAWFASKAMGRRFARLASHTHVVDFGRRDVFVYVKADPKKALVVPYADVKGYRLIRQGKALRLLLSGDWVSHPSGYQLVDINRPFAASTLDALEENIQDVMREHHVRRAKK